MRKLILAACLLIVATACGSSSSSSGTSKQIVVGFSNYALAIPYYRAMRAGVLDAAAKYGWKVVVTDSNFDPAKQVSQVQDLITQHVDLIICSPGDANALVPAYKAANDAGIPIMSVGNHIAASSSKYELTFYGRRWDEIGQMRAEELATLMGGQGKAAALRGPSGVAFVEEEKAGYNAAMAGHSQISTVYDQYSTGLTNSEGLRLAQDALTAHPDLTGIWTETDDLAIGAIQAIKARNLVGRVSVVSMDGDPAAMALVQQGSLTYTLVVPAYLIATNFMDVAYKYLVNKQKPQSYYAAPVIPVTKDNATQVLANCSKTSSEVYCGGAP